MSRITTKKLESAVDSLNDASQRCGDWYRVQYYNGACRLTASRGTIDIQPALGTKKECYYTVRSILNVLHEEAKALGIHEILAA